MSRWLIRFLALAGLASAGVALAVSAAVVQSAPAGNAADGKAFWEFSTTWCSRCHGVNGEGAYGPDLAGRGLTFEQFARAVRQPWGVMPAYTERQVSDQNVADLVAYLNGLRPVAEPGPWRTSVPTNAPLAQRLLVETAGCGQCHGADLGNPRRVAGEVGGDFAWFAEQIYDHTKEWAGGRMGNYSPARLPEETLRAIWNYVAQELGLRVPIDLQVKAEPTGDGTSYSLTMLNRGALAANNLFITLRVPEGSIVSAVSTPAGSTYQGLQQHAPGSYSSAVWLLPRVAPKERVGPFAIRVSGDGSAAGSHAWVRWAGPPAGGETAMASSSERPIVDLQGIASGGRLYDSWWTEQGKAAPKGNQALWSRQTTNTRSGETTSRCKECHAWDYLGKDGAYGSGSRYTGFDGVFTAGAQSADALTAAIAGATNPQHNFSGLLSAQAIQDVVNFLRSGLTDEREYLDYSTRKVKVPVSLAAGKRLFDTTCAACHGRDGQGLNFGSEASPEYVGTVANSNPQETLHKIRYGQPGTTMPSAVVNGWTTQQILDVLAYAQTLPRD